MSSEPQVEFTKDNLDLYLKALAKEYRKLVGKSMPAELILIGGASVLINYGFREMTTDVDAIIQAASGMKDAISRVADQYHLPAGWLNSDFTQTTSYSEKLLQYSKYYRTFSNVVEIRTVDSEYLIAMKLRAGRPYKNDFSDILGVLAAHEMDGTPLTLESIQTAVENLYGSWDLLPEQSRNFIQQVMQRGQFEKQYHEVTKNEEKANHLLIKFEEKYPRTLTESNIQDILKKLE